MKVWVAKVFAVLAWAGLLVLAVPAPQALAQDAADSAQGSLADQIQDIKQQTLQLNRDLFILEEELLYPTNTQMAVYLSVDIGTFFALDAVKLSIDGTVVANYLYTERQVDALQRGGIHRLYLGNVKNGPHEVVAVFTGKGPQDRDYRRATSLVVEKTAGAKNLELQISDSEARQQPEFMVREW
ncbi:AraC family transcriptional regulator [Mangrovimicrobium sediminis]|uniref:AraC family transcriptional regulator n=1 Tax=Mangrovimicrobium sediminis TaxID=2562682 RepID=A0A4Z0M8D2_9GAMM|nr:AraC family transcriptional regulator [Haliea sp. SAOS-164]TGD75628.1 AraC family transcriptional regulator [Haliea sp. SAOS-164]